MYFYQTCKSILHLLQSAGQANFVPFYMPIHASSEYTVTSQSILSLQLLFLIADILLPIILQQSMAAIHPCNAPERENQKRSLCIFFPLFVLCFHIFITFINFFTSWCHIHCLLLFLQSRNFGFVCYSHSDIIPMGRSALTIS